jgi:hypothetical protein
MQFWNEIINTALLGTEKRPLPLNTLPVPIQQAAATIAENAGTVNPGFANTSTATAPPDPEDQFLQLAALSFNFRQSGTKPLHQPDLNPPAAEPETLPYCTPRAAQVLKDILAEDSPQLLTSWLDHCVAAKQLAQPETLPTILNRAANHKAIQKSVKQASGNRGQWLSQFNPAWQFGNEPNNEEELWNTGTPEQRRAALKNRRSQDPARTREWLTATWPRENANARVELLKQLDGAIQPEDEPWLTSLLNEKSQKVKDEAIRLLLQLPGSQIVNQYKQLIAPLIFLKKEKALLGLTTKTSLQILPPAVPDKGEYAPGIDNLSSDKTYKDGEFVLYQLIQNIPPAFWEQHLAMTPTAIIDLFLEKAEKYLTAFAHAIKQFKDANWAEACLDHHVIIYLDLLEILPPSKREVYAIRHFKQFPEQIIIQTREWPQEWGLALTKEIIAHTARLPYQYNNTFYKTNIQRIPTSIKDSLDSYGPVEPHIRPNWINILDQFRRLLSLKAQTQIAFKEQT